MIVTEEEAQSIVCPLRDFGQCLHTRCMAWRWEDAGRDASKLPDSYLSSDLDDPRGYCGLAGTPVALR